MNEAVLLNDVYSSFGTGNKNRKPYSKKGEKVKIVSTHDKIIIVENKEGNRFSVKTSEIQNL